MGNDSPTASVAREPRGRSLLWLVGLLGVVACAAAGRSSETGSPGTSGGPQRGDAPTSASPPRLGSLGASRFFFSGDGNLRLRSAHSGAEIRVRYRELDGSYRESALREIDSLFRSRGDAATTRVALRLVEILDYLEDTEKPSQILLVSGYRSGEYNAAIRARGAQAAKSSMHSEGFAADVKLPGLDLEAAWNRIRALGCCGIGYYASGQFLHVDVGRPRFWEETTSRVKENLSAGNARVFARTVYDRYANVDGIDLTLHAVTKTPLWIDPKADLVTDDESSLRWGSLTVEASAVGVGRFDPGAGCIRFDGDAPPGGYRLRVAKVEASRGSARLGGGQRSRISLHTCMPRLEATPEVIQTNPIEIETIAKAAPLG